MSGVELDRWAEVPFRVWGGMAGELGFSLRAVDCHHGFSEEIKQ